MTVGVGLNIPGITKDDASIAFGSIWGTTRFDAIDVAVTHTSGYRKAGEVDGIDHDRDEVWFLVNPTMAMTATAESYYGPASVTWTLDGSEELRPYYLYVGELRGTIPLPDAVRADLERWGLTQADLSQLLKAHPFPDGIEPNAPLDPARFEYVNTFAYRPPFSGTSPSNSQPFALGRKVTNTSGLSADISFSTDAEFSASATFFLIASASIKLSSSYVVTTSTSAKSALANESTSTLSVGQPSFGYGGPSVLRVYEDKVFKTFFFTLDWE